MMATFFFNLAACTAAFSPAGPEPITSKSYCNIETSRIGYILSFNTANASKIPFRDVHDHGGIILPASPWLLFAVFT